MDAPSLINYQLQPEYQLSTDGYLMPYPGSPEQAYDLVYQQSHGYQLFLNQAIPDQVRAKLLAIAPQAGRVVCRPISVRQNDQSAEVYVETLPDYQKKGYSHQAVASWTLDVRESGGVPFYSYKLRNHPSAALAHGLGVSWFANMVEFEAG
jgi:hypothetical protein